MDCLLPDNPTIIHKSHNSHRSIFSISSLLYSLLFTCPIHLKLESCMYFFLSKQETLASVQAIHDSRIVSAVGFLDQRSWLLPPVPTLPALKYLLPPRPLPLEASRRTVKKGNQTPSPSTSPRRSPPPSSDAPRARAAPF